MRGQSINYCSTIGSNYKHCDSDHHGVEDSDNDDSEYGYPILEPAAALSGDRITRQKKLVGTSLWIPPHILSKPNIVSLATRLKMTPTQQAAFTQGLISESGGDVSTVVSSYATADRSRRKVIGEISENIKDQGEPPKLYTSHYTGMAS